MANNSSFFLESGVFYPFNGSVGNIGGAGAAGMAAIWTSATILGSIAIGTGASNLLQLDASGRLPAIDGSLLTNLNPVFNTTLSVGALGNTQGVFFGMTHMVGRLRELIAVDDVGLTANFTQSGAQDDVTRASWGIHFGPGSDTFVIGRAAAGTTPPFNLTPLLQMTKFGQVIAGPPAGILAGNHFLVADFRTMGADAVLECRQLDPTHPSAMRYTDYLGVEKCAFGYDNPSSTWPYVDSSFWEGFLGTVDIRIISNANSGVSAAWAKATGDFGIYATTVLGTTYGTKTFGVTRDTGDTTCLGVLQAVGGGIFGVNVGSGSTTPVNVSLGGSFGTNTPGSTGNIKLSLFKDSVGDHYGIGISGGLMEFTLSPSGSGWGWFIGGATVGDYGKTTASTWTFAGDTVSTGKLVSSSPTGGIGYVAGSGGAVTQATSKATGATLNKVNGQITLNNAALAAATIVSFTFTNSTIGATDLVHVQHVSAGTLGAYTVTASAGAAGSTTVFVRNNTAGSLSEAIVIQFAVIKNAQT